MVFFFSLRRHYPHQVFRVSHLGLSASPMKLPRKAFIKIQNEQSLSAFIPHVLYLLNLEISNQSSSQQVFEWCYRVDDAASILHLFKHVKIQPRKVS
jgi:hypothetical protein